STPQDLVDPPGAEDVPPVEPEVVSVSGVDGLLIGRSQVVLFRIPAIRHLVVWNETGPIERAALSSSHSDPVTTGSDRKQACDAHRDVARDVSIQDVLQWGIPVPK